MSPDALTMDADTTPFLTAGSSLPSPVPLELGDGGCVVVSRAAPDRTLDDPNQDAAAVVSLSGGAVLVVADGLGGLAGGAEAAKKAVAVVVDAVTKGPGDTIREAILDGFERADAALHGHRTRGQTTLIAAEIQQSRVRIYNVGDSSAMQVGGGGKIKHQTVAHSPVGYLVAAGLLDQEEALHHDALHLISNTVGADSMRIDIGPAFELAPRDTLILGTDGLFDNLLPEEVAEVIRKGPLLEAAHTLVDAVLQRMSQPETGSPSKVDDFTFVLYRSMQRVSG